MLLLARGGVLSPAVWRFLPLHVEMMVIGWLVQLALGVAFWILPKYRRGAERGWEWPGWLAGGLINIGVLAAGVGSSLGPTNDGASVGRAIEAGAALCFAATLWPRIKPFGRA
jgi:hypothetical protein